MQYLYDNRLYDTPDVPVRLLEELVQRAIENEIAANGESSPELSALLRHVRLVGQSFRAMQARIDLIEKDEKQRPLSIVHEI